LLYIEPLDDELCFITNHFSLINTFSWLQFVPVEGWSASSAPPASSQPSALKSTLTSTQSLLPSPRCHGVEHHAPGVTHPVDATWPVAASVALREQGYVVLSSLIPPRKVARALQYMNHHLGSANLSADLDPSGLGSEFYGPPGGDASDPNSPTGVLALAVLPMCHACGVAGSGSVTNVSRIWCCWLWQCYNCVTRVVYPSDLPPPHAWKRVAIMQDTKRVGSLSVSFLILL
jgi:hypothetical protein